MADIKFRCPECAQKIAVDVAAVGVRVNCPSCHSTLIIPPSSDAPVVVVARRKLAVVAGSMDALYKDIEQKQLALDAAVAESRKAREEADKQRAAAEEISAERDRLKGERERIRRANEEAASELEKLRSELSNANAEREGLRKRADETALISSGGGNQIIERLRAEYAEIQKERDELATKLTAMSSLREQLSTVTAERDQLIGKASAAAGEVDALRGDASGLRGEIGALQARLVQADRRLHEAEARAAAAGRERDEWKNKAVATEMLPAELLAAREETQKIRSQFGELARALEAARLDRDQALAVASDREKMMERLSQAAEAAKVEMGKLREDAGMASMERERLKVSAEEFREETRELQQRVDGLLDELHARERDVADLKKAMETAAVKDAAKDEEIRRVQAFLLERDREKRELVARADFVSGQASEKEAELGRVKAEVAELSSKLAARERECADLFATVEKLKARDEEVHARADHAERSATGAEERAQTAEDERARLAEQLGSRLSCRRPGRIRSGCRRRRIRRVDE